MSNKISVGLLPLALALASGPAAWAQPTPDHLKCYKIKDPQPKTIYMADLAGLAPEPGCLIKVPAKLACVPTTKTNVMPAPPGGGGTGIPNTFLCYAVKCPKSATALPGLNVQDQFGIRTVQPSTPKILCAPGVNPNATTTTTTTTSSTTSTTQCPMGQIVCGNICINPATDPMNCGMCGHVCSMGEVCSSGMCTCPPGDVLCGTTCVNTSTDPNNCGMCGHACPMGTSCVSGVCTCPAGQVLCGSTCVNTSTDPNNCGSCGSVCFVANGTPACTAGMCTIASCNAGFANCDNNPANGCEVNTTTDPMNCGGCGIVCPLATPTCTASVCH